MAAKGLGLLTFQSAIKGGVRPNLFSVEHGFPTGVAEPTIDGTGKPEESVTYMCKAAALPATNVGTVELPFRGRVLKVPGDRTAYDNNDSYEEFDVEFAYQFHTSKAVDAGNSSNDSLV